MYYIYDDNDSLVYSTKSPVDAKFHAKDIDGAHIEYDEWAR